jgi:hypothetical protein
MNWFKMLPWQFKLAIIIAIILLIWLAWRKFGYKVGQLTQARDITLLPGESKNLTSEQESNAKDIAQFIFNDIEDTPITGHDYSSYDQALLLTDKEMNFMADYYKKFLGNGETMYKAIDSQYYITSGVPQKLMARLAAIGKR